MKKGLSGSTLKIFAILIMLIDHTTAVLMLNYMRYTQQIKEYRSQYLFLRGVGRLAMPIFCFLLIEGFKHTKNYKKYLLNLFVFALISEIPFDLAFREKFIAWDYSNVFFTLLIGLLVIGAAKNFGNKEYKKKLIPLYILDAIIIGPYFCYMFSKTWIYGKNFEIVKWSEEFWMAIIISSIVGIAVIGFVFYKLNKENANYYAVTIAFLVLGSVVAFAMKTDYKGFGVLVIVAMYLLRWDKMLAVSVGCGLLFIYNNTEWSAFIILPLIAFYNGKRGISLKYFFYAFYPVHLVILYLIALMNGYVTFGWL